MQLSCTSGATGQTLESVTHAQGKASIIANLVQPYWIYPGTIVSVSQFISITIDIALALLFNLGLDAHSGPLHIHIRTPIRSQKIRHCEALAG